MGDSSKFKRGSFSLDHCGVVAIYSSHNTEADVNSFCSSCRTIDAAELVFYRGSSAVVAVIP